MMNEILFLLAGLIAGLILGRIIFYRKQELNTANAEAEQNLAVLTQQLSDERNRFQLLQTEKLDLNKQLMEINAARAHAEAKNEALNNRLETQKKEFEDLHKTMQDQFRSIATDILQKSSSNVQEEHRVRLNDILMPLREKIDRFETQVTRTNEERIREHQSMREQLSMLQQMNKTIGDEARNLVSALKGQSKTQGNWGEMILEKVLESSGLVKGREYFVQTSMSDETGKRLQPDVIIHLPEQRHLVVDSKVSLIAYERYCNATDETQKVALLNDHIISLKKHIRDLSSKNYQSLYDINSLDFVLLFVPVEPAFTAAIEQDPEIYNDAFSRNIVVVSTSTLLATLRTIANIWRMEYQNKNTVEIARQAGALYDKFAGLVDDLMKVGVKLDDAKDAYDDSMKKLHTGKGNLVTRVEELKKLGLKASKQVNPKVIEQAQDLIESDVPSVM